MIKKVINSLYLSLIIIGLISTNVIGVFNTFDDENIGSFSLADFPEKKIIIPSSKFFITSAINNSDIINDYTWSLMRYDHIVGSENFENIDVPKPSQGIVLIATNYLSPETCEAAVSVYHEDAMDTLLALEDYDVEHMVHSQTAFFKNQEEWNSPNIDSYRKSSAHEMKTLGDITLKGKMLGDCYSQASFNTAVLRLCGFSPEEVFNVHVPGHIFNIVKIEDKWYAFDSVYARSVRRGFWDSCIFESYDPPLEDYILFMENDKYFINFGHLWPEYWPYFEDLYNNMEPSVLSDILKQVVPLLNNSIIGANDWDINYFIENATICPDMINDSLTYTVLDATGNNLEEKTESLLDMNWDFTINLTNQSVVNQYDRSIYSLGYLDVAYPQVYANAAKYAAWTSWFGIKLDGILPLGDLYRTAIWARLNFKNMNTALDDCVFFSDLLYIRHAGSTLDQSLVAYGTLRNMKNKKELWSPDDLYVVVTDTHNGYLAAKTQNSWKYINFGGGKLVLSDLSENISFVFNEENKFSSLP